MAVWYPLLSVDRASRIVGPVTGAHCYILTLRPIFPRRCVLERRTWCTGLTDRRQSIAVPVSARSFRRSIRRHVGTDCRVGFDCRWIELAGVARSYWALLLCAGLSSLSQSVFHPPITRTFGPSGRTSRNSRASAFTCSAALSGSTLHRSSLGWVPRSSDGGFSPRYWYRWHRLLICTDVNA